MVDSLSEIITESGSPMELHSATNAIHEIE